MRRRQFLATIATAAGGCSSGDRLVVGVAPKGTSSIFWQSVRAGALAAGAEFDVEILWNGPPQETEYARQIQIVDSMINRRVDGIVLSPAESTALVGVVERAADLGIPVTIFDAGISTERYVSYVATDNTAAGSLGAETLAGLLGGEGDVAMIQHMPGSDSTESRERGFSSAIETDYPGLEVVARQFCLSDRARALAISEDILTAHPGLQGFFCSSEAATIGAARALQARERGGSVKLVGFDASPSLQQDLRAGVIDALIVQDPFRIGYAGVETIVRKLKGETPPRRIDLPARAIRAADLDDPEVKRLLNPTAG
jgi:ribose transport system substrate-binding protein